MSDGLSPAQGGSECDLPRESAWNVWIHPRRTARCLDSLRAELADADSRRALAAQRADDTDALCAQLRDDNERLRQRLSAVENANTRLEAEMKQMKSDEEYQREVDARLAELDKELRKVDAMKQRYEATIAALKERLVDARSELQRKRHPSSEINDLIDMDRPVSPSYNPATPTSSPSSSRPTNPNRPIDQSRRPIKPPTAPPRPRRDDTDWLQPLPDNI